MFLLDGVDPIQTQSLPVNELWYFLPFGYLLTILIETPFLYLGLPRKFTARQKLLCGIWLTACTYPIVVLVLPTILFGFPRWQYLLVAEIFAPAAECLIFWLAFRRKENLENTDWLRSFAAIIIANLASFGFGELLATFDWFGFF